MTRGGELPQNRNFDISSKFFNSAQQRVNKISSSSSCSGCLFDHSDIVYMYLSSNFVYLAAEIKTENIRLFFKKIGWHLS